MSGMNNRVVAALGTIGEALGLAKAHGGMIADLNAAQIQIDQPRHGKSRARKRGRRGPAGAKLWRKASEGKL